MFNYYILEKIRNKESENDRYRNDKTYISKRNMMAERYRERVVKFIERMAVKPLKERDQVSKSLLEMKHSKSKMLGSFTLVGKEVDEK